MKGVQITFFVRFKESIKKIKKFLPSACFLLVSLLIFTAIDVKAATLNVPGGYGSIQAAVNAAASGDVINVGAGTYNERVMISKSGISIVANPARSATVDGSGKVSMYEGIFTIDGASNVKISGFKVQSSDYAGIGVNGRGSSSNIIIENNYVTNTKSSAIFAGNAFSVTIDGNELTWAHEWPGGTENEVLSLITVDGFDIKNNWIHDNQNTESIDVKWGSKNGRVHHNNIKSVRSAGIYFDAWSEIQDNNEVYDNFVHDGGATSRGIAIAVENGGGIKNMKVYNNIVYNNSANGIVVEFYTSCDHSPCPPGPLEYIYITNNTVVKNNCGDNWEGGIVNKSAQATTNNIYFRNNISSQNCGQQFWIAAANTTIEYNLIDGSSSATCNNCVTGNPDFVTPSADFHLKSTSIAIDKGTSAGAPSTDYDGSARPVNAVYDIGAYEYGGAPPLCNNNIVMDNGETGVDCGGGGCPACGAPVCNNNKIKDNGETGVDCGGGGCAACACSDTCSSLGLICGDQTICGSTINCGSCLSPYVCSAGRCNCAPTLTCADYPEKCGPNLYDGCSNALNCPGNCPAGQICTPSGLCRLPLPPPPPCSDLYGGLIPCGRKCDDPSTSWNETKACNFCHTFLFLQLIIEFLVKITAAAAFTAIALAGFLYVFAAGSSELISKAKQMMKFALIGFVVVFIAWALVDSIFATAGFIDPMSGKWYAMECDS